MDVTGDQSDPLSSPRSSRDGLRLRDLLFAAVVGFSKALGWDEKVPDEQIVAISPDLDTGGLDLIFGDLDPLD